MWVVIEVLERHDGRNHAWLALSWLALLLRHQLGLVLTHIRGIAVVCGVRQVGGLLLLDMMLLLLLAILLTIW